MNPFIYSEGKIAGAAGVSRYDMRNLREKFLKEGVDWKNLGGKRGGVGLTLEGAQHVLEEIPNNMIDLDTCKILSAVPVLAEPTLEPHCPMDKSGEARESIGQSAGPQQETRTADSRGGTHTFTVFKLVPNPRVVLAKDSTGNLQTVWVGRSQNFVVGDEIEVAPHESQVDVWRFTGVMPKDRRRQRLRA